MRRFRSRRLQDRRSRPCAMSLPRSARTFAGAGVSWPGYGAGASTWPRVKSGSRKPSRNWIKAVFGPARQSPGPESVRWRFLKRSCQRSAGIWTDSPSRGSGGSSSSVLRVASCAARTSTSRSGPRPAWQWVCRKLHFHDLRHTGGTLSAATGATLKASMARQRAFAPRCSYQHATRDRDQAIAKALSTFVREVRSVPEKAAEDRKPGGQSL